MKYFHCSWLAIAAFILVIINNPAFAIDNPDAPDLMAEFEIREKPLLAAIDSPSNTTRDYVLAYTHYLEFLDRELNQVYQGLRAKLPHDKQKQLKSSQVKWLKYRDTEFAFIDNTWTAAAFGSSSSISRGQYKAAVVRDRVMQLMHYARNF